MRKITEQAIRAFNNNEKFTSGNTKVRVEYGVTRLLLWDNTIAHKKNGNLFVSLCGYNTVTTRERLNGLDGVSITSRNFTPYLNGKEIDAYEVYKV